MSAKGFTLAIARRQSKRALPLLLAAPALPPRKLPERPIFVIGCPRSGTTLAARLITLAPETASLGTEGHVFWESFHHPRAKGWASNALDASDVGAVERRYLAWAIPALAGKGRFVDKTPRNVLRLPYLEALFPDATYVFTFRDGRAIVSSLIAEWPRGGRPPYLLPKGFAVQGVPERTWRFVLPPGWERFNGRPLEELCAHQYVTCTEALLRFRDELPAERFVDLRYEELVGDPLPQVARVYDRLGLRMSDRVEERTGRVVRPPRSPERWETEHREEIERVLPAIRPMLERTAYLP